jgi:hypothetical protein
MDVQNIMIMLCTENMMEREHSISQGLRLAEGQGGLFMNLLSKLVK